MPNHITNIIYVSGSGKTINKYLNFVKSDPVEKEDDESMGFDFEKIIPMPAHIYRGNLGIEEEERYGKENCWYKWSIKNWGTKWNCYNVSTNCDTIQFDTAWATPLPIFEALSKQFKSLKFEVHYADEDMGNNCGIITLKGGKIIDHWEPPTEDEAMDFAVSVKGYDLCIKI